ncbi:MAG: GNAT family N-acetyltransferase [Bacteroidota bacterium]
MELIRTDSTHKDFIHLVHQLDEFLSEIDGEDHAFYNQFNSIETLKNVVLLRVDGIIIGCGAFKPYNDHTIEIKRMFVLPEKRKLGAASAILTELELWAVELSFKRSILETGLEMKSAIRLYQLKGYEQIPNYGQYLGAVNSVCFEKRL